MDKFVRLTSWAAPLLRSNIDTDAISPGDRLMRVMKSGFEDALFANWRLNRLADGTYEDNPEFILNQPPYHQAEILLAGPNFGCGSSRENAVWALRDWGMKTIIAPSFGGIFLANCFKNGVLTVVLPFAQIQEIANEVLEHDGLKKVTVDLDLQFVEAPNGFRYQFEIGDYQKQILLKGLDAISAALIYRNEIDAYQERDSSNRPWIYSVPLMSGAHA